MCEILNYLEGQIEEKLRQFVEAKKEYISMKKKYNLDKNEDIYNLNDDEIKMVAQDVQQYVAKHEITLDDLLMKKLWKLQEQTMRSYSLPHLSKQEMRVLAYIVEGFTNKETATKLFISVRTVDSHRRNLLQKIGVKNTAGLVKYYLEKMAEIEKKEKEREEKEKTNKEKEITNKII